MSTPQLFTYEQTKEIGEKLGVTWDKFSVEQFRTGLDIELEHGKRDSNTNITNNDPMETGKIVLAHLNELPDYYTKLQKIEDEEDDEMIMQAN